MIAPTTEPGALAPLAAFDIEGGAELLVVLLLVGASLAQRVIKAMREQKEGKEGPRPSPGGPKRRPAQDPLEGWKALLRGEAPPPPRRPAQGPSERSAAPARTGGAAQAARPARARRPRPEEVVLSEPLAGLGPVPAEERLERGEAPPRRDEAPRLAGAAFAEVPSEADLERAGRDLAAATAAPLSAGFPSMAAPGAAVTSRGARAAAGWRDAIVAAELLGPPLGLRPSEFLPGAPPR